MSHLNPRIVKKLQAFAQRRRRLIVVRGICAAVAMLLGVMMLVAAVDWFLVLDDTVRWTLSAVAYVSVLIAEWRACVRLLLHLPDPRRLARLIEHAEPKLREDLLSAVELGQGDAALDSEQFRQLVQADVASRIESVDINRLLPVNLVRRSLLVVSGVIAVCAIALVLTGFQFSTSMLRALLPMLNLARVSKVQVKVVEPAPADATVPQGDAIPLVIEIGGARTSSATLELFTKSGGREKVKMNPSAKDRFSANIQVAREDVVYRIRSGDAMTRKYTLHAAARPRIVQFQKTYNYPEYTLLKPKQVAEESGDLAGLEQTKVDLELQPDQPIASAKLTIEQGKVTTEVPLAKLPNGRLSAKVPLDKNGIYRVHLVAANTGFENKFSPEYEIRADPDLIPQVELETPAHDLILPANELVDITGTATDDLSVARVEQKYRVNGGEWISAPLKTATGPKVKINSRWDLLQTGLKAGDTITTKLVAYDLKKNAGESRPVQITLTSAGFEIRRLQAIEAERNLQKALVALRSSGESMAKLGAESRDQFGRLAEADPQRKQATLGFVAAMDDFEAKEAEAATDLAAILRACTPGHETGKLVMLGRILGQTMSGGEQISRDIVNVVTSDPSAVYARDFVREAADGASAAARFSGIAQDSQKTFLAAEELDVLNENLGVVAREQERIAGLAKSSGEDAAKWAQLAGRIRVVLTEARSLEELMRAAAEHSPGGVNDRLRNQAKQIHDRAAEMDKLVVANAAGKQLLPATQNLTKTLVDARRDLLDLRGNMSEPPLQAYKNLAQEVQPDWTHFEKLRQEMESRLRNDKVPQEARTAFGTARWASRAGYFKTHGDFEESRPDSDNYFVSDVRMLSLALEAQKAVVPAEHIPSPEWDKSLAQINEMDQAFRVLETGHDLAEIAEGIDHLAAGERWEFATLRSRTSNLGDWKWLDLRLHMTPDEIGKTQITNEETKKVIPQVQKIIWDAQNAQMKPVNAEMALRYRADHEPVALPRDLQRVAERVRAALALLRKPMNDARTVLAKMAPKLSEVAAQLAKESQELKKESDEHAAKAAEKTPEQAQADARQELAQQQKLNEKVEELKDALRADAGKQDIMKEEGREHARDVDDALAMLHEPPPRAEDALNEATQAERPAAQQDAMKAAATEQQKMADALNQVAQHFDALEQGANPEQTRTALRDAEKQLGEKEALDRQYADAQHLAEMARLSPQEMLKQLEKALPQNPAMQQELSAIAHNMLDSAATKLAEASNKEQGVAGDVQKLAEQQQAQAQQNPAGQQPPNAQQNPAGQQPPNAQQNPAGQQPPNAQQNPAGQQPPNAQQNPAGQQPPNAQQNPAGQQPPNAQQNPAGQQPPNAQQNPAGQQPPNAQQNPAAQQPPNALLAQAAGAQPQIAHNADEAAAEIQRAGRHEERLRNEAAGQQLQQLGQHIEQTAENRVPEAQHALAGAQMAAQAQTPLAEASTELHNELAQLNQAQESHPAGEHPAGEHPAGEHPAGEHPAGEHPAGEHPAGEHPAGEPHSGQPEAPHQGGEHAGEHGQETAQGSHPGAEAGSPHQGSPEAGQPESGQPGNPGEQPPAGQMANAQATPQEQAWMARTLDALDAALHANAADAQGQPPGEAGQPGQEPPGQGQEAQAQPGQGQPGQPEQGGQPGQPGQPGQSPAQQAMAAAAQASAAALRAARSEAAQQPGAEVSKGEQQAKSMGGAKAQAGNLKHGVLPDVKLTQAGDWGRLPKKVAEQLSQGQREGVSGEYRNQVETYYRVIAERAKKQ